MSDRDAHRLEPLLRETLRGQAQARNELLGRLRPWLQVLIRSWLGPELARQLVDSDVVQETLLRIDRGLPAFRGQTVPELLAWARQIAYHAAADRKRQAGLFVPSGDLLQALVARGPSPLEELERAEEMLRVTEAMQRLPRARREIVQARLFEGRDYADIAAGMQTTEEALRVLLHRALQQLREILESGT